MTEAAFNNALWEKKQLKVAGSDDLWRLYNELSENADGSDVMAKLDAYKDDTSPEAREVYFAIINGQ